MDYADTHLNVYIHFHASDMVLMIDTNATYLVMPKTWFRIAGYYYIRNKPNAKPHPELNGAMIIDCKTLNPFVASTTEA